MLLVMMMMAEFSEQWQHIMMMIMTTTMMTVLNNDNMRKDDNGDDDKFCQWRFQSNDNMELVTKLQGSDHSTNDLSARLANQEDEMKELREAVSLHLLQRKWWQGGNGSSTSAGVASSLWVRYFQQKPGELLQGRLCNRGLPTRMVYLNHGI